MKHASDVVKSASDLLSYLQTPGTVDGEYNKLVARLEDALFFYNNYDVEPTDD